MTYKYKLYRFENGIGETIFKAKYKSILGFWRWITKTQYQYDHSWTEVCVWWARDHATDQIKTHAETRRRIAADKQQSKLKNTMKLVIIEEIEA